MITEPIWREYATYDEDGYVSGVRDDAPQEAKDAYRKYVEEQNEYVARGEMIPK